MSLYTYHLYFSLHVCKKKKLKREEKTHLKKKN